MITEAGNHPKVAGLAYIAAFAPDKGESVATLIKDRPVPRYKQLSLLWNGRRGTARSQRTVTSATGHAYILPATRGGRAPAGEYRVRLRLSRQREPVLSPRSFTLDALWYGALRSQLVRIVVVRDPSRRRHDEAFFCTDLT